MATYNYISASGAVIPDTSTVLAEVEAEYKEVYGSDFVVDPSSEQGREIDAEVTSRMSVIRNNAKLANQINPNLAEGVFLDAVYALANGQRDGEERSTVICELSGVPGTVIQKGSVVSDVNREEWESLAGAIIPASGSVTVGFRSINYGPIEAAIGEVDTIVTGVLGWEAVTNISAAIPGKLKQSDVSTRKQRKVELGGNANNNTLAIITAINALENVKSLRYWENYTNDPITVDGVTLKPNSTYVCVDGGVDLEVAEAYYQHRSGGSGFNGNETVVVTDPNSLQPIDVQFDRPIDKPKLIRITVRSQAGLYLTDAVKKAAVDYANGLISGEAGFVVGADASPFEVAAAVNLSVEGVFVSKCEISEDDGAPSFTTNTLTTKINEKASLTESGVTVVIL